MPLRPAKLLIGLGNILRRDEGIGVVVAQRFARLRLPCDVQVHEAGTHAFDLADLMVGRQLVVVVDALKADGPPGAVYRFSPGQVRAHVRSGLSLHDLHLLDALDETCLLGAPPRTVVVFAVQVADISTGLGLSGPVRRAAPGLMMVVARELGLDASVLGLRAEKTTLGWLDRVMAGESTAEDEPWN